MNSIITLMEGIQIKLDVATNSGNLEQVALLQCAQGNANAQAQHLMASLEPVSVLLELAGTLFDIAKVRPITLPSIGSQSDVESLKSLVKAVQEATAVIQKVVDGIGGCETS
jgi:hypothetical protein